MFKNISIFSNQNISWVQNISILSVYITRIFIKVWYILIRIQNSENYSNQLVTTFNAARQSSTASSHTFWVIYLSGSNKTKKGSLETALLHIFFFLGGGGRVYIEKEYNPIDKNNYEMSSHTFLYSQSIQRKILL